MVRLRCARCLPGAILFMLLHKFENIIDVVCDILIFKIYALSYLLDAGFNHSSPHLMNASTTTTSVYHKLHRARPTTSKSAPLIFSKGTSSAYLGSTTTKRVISLALPFHHKEPVLFCITSTYSAVLECTEGFFIVGTPFSRCRQRYTIVL